MTAKDAYWFPHDSNASRDPKIQAMLAVYGWEGYGWFWSIIEDMRDQADYTLERRLNDVRTLSYRWRCDAQTAENFLRDCIETFQLFEADETHIWSRSLINRMAFYDERRRKFVDAGRKSGEIRREKSLQATTHEQPSNDVHATFEQGQDITGQDITENEESATHSSQPTQQDTDYKAFEDSFVSRWNGLPIAFPRIAKIGKGRRAKLKARYGDKLFREKLPEIIERIGRSSFLAGGGNSNWRATADWLIGNDTNYVKVLEGSYDNGKGNTNGTSKPDRNYCPTPDSDARRRAALGLPPRAEQTGMANRDGQQMGGVHG